MRMKIFALALTLPALALAGCGKSSTSNTTTTETTVLDNSIDQNVMPAAEPMSNDANATIGDSAMTAQQFADTAAASDAYEVAAGKLAQNKATSQALKDFGAMMVKDHTDSTAKLKAAAAKADPKIAPNSAMTDEQKADLDVLKSAKGADFDAAYKSQQVAAHQKALGAVQGYADAGTVPTIKAWAQTVAPIVQTHLDKIQGM